MASVAVLPVNLTPGNLALLVAELYELTEVETAVVAAELRSWPKDEFAHLAEPSAVYLHAARIAETLKRGRANPKVRSCYAQLYQALQEYWRNASRR